MASLLLRLWEEQQRLLPLLPLPLLLLLLLLIISQSKCQRVMGHNSSDQVSLIRGSDGRVSVRLLVKVHRVSCRQQWRSGNPSPVNLVVHLLLLLLLQVVMVVVLMRK